MLFVFFFMTLWCSDANHFSTTTSTHNPACTDHAMTRHQLNVEHPLLDLNDITTEDNFGAQMNAILQDFPNQFMNVKSLPWSDSDTFPIPRFHSHIRLGIATYTFIQEEQPSRHATYQANFPGSTVPDFAVQSYTSLKSNFEYYEFPCGSFTRAEEISDGTKRSQLYHINMATDKSNLAFQNMVVEIGIEQGMTVGGPGNETIVWVPFVKVYGK